MDLKPVNLTEAPASFKEIYSPRGRGQDQMTTTSRSPTPTESTSGMSTMILTSSFGYSKAGSTSRCAGGMAVKDRFSSGKATLSSFPGVWSTSRRLWVGQFSMFEPSGTSSTGDRYRGDLPDHVDSTTGRDLS